DLLALDLETHGVLSRARLSDDDLDGARPVGTVVEHGAAEDLSGCLGADGVDLGAVLGEVDGFGVAVEGGHGVGCSGRLAAFRPGTTRPRQRNQFQPLRSAFCAMQALYSSMKTRENRAHSS